MKEPNKGNSTTNQESLNDVCKKKAEVKLKHVDQEVFLSTESKQQIEVNTIINGQQSNWQEQNKEHQHNAAAEEIQTVFVYWNKNKEAIIHEEGKLEEGNPSDQKGNEDERILCDDTEIHGRESEKPLETKDSSEADNENGELEKLRGRKDIRDPDKGNRGLEETQGIVQEGIHVRRASARSIKLPVTRNNDFLWENEV
jgi:hypothetical protein